MPSYIYLVEWANGKKKIGRTTQKVCTYFFDRLRAYGECVIIKISRVSTHYVVQIEAAIVAEFTRTFQLAHGLEYFYGDSKKMEEIIDDHVAKYRYMEDPVAEERQPAEVTEIPVLAPLLGLVMKQKGVHICEGCGKDYTTRQAKYLHKQNNTSCKNAKSINIYEIANNMQKHMNAMSARITKLELLRK